MYLTIFSWIYSIHSGQDVLQLSFWFCSLTSLLNWTAERRVWGLTLNFGQKLQIFNSDFWVRFKVDKTCMESYKNKNKEKYSRLSGIVHARKRIEKIRKCWKVVPCFGLLENNWIFNKWKSKDGWRMQEVRHCFHWNARKLWILNTPLLCCTLKSKAVSNV